MMARIGPHPVSRHGGDGKVALFRRHFCAIVACQMGRVNSKRKMKHPSYIAKMIFESRCYLCVGNSATSSTTEIPIYSRKIVIKYVDELNYARVYY